jgi:ferrous iron transport protein A
MKNTVMTTLSELVSGDRARILKIRGSGPRSIRQRLLDMGITRGTEVYVERHAPLGDPVEIAIKGYNLALRLNEAQHIEVEKV